VIEYNPGRRWYWFSRIRCNEATVFKTNDSPDSARAPPAFEDPTAEPNAFPRESIEVRALAFF